MKKDTPSMSQLTPRELAVLAYIGLPDKQAADELRISVSTLRHHYSSISSKLRVRGRTALAMVFVLSPQCPKSIRIG